ncbi:hypothetical protein TW95_gp1332 [Pandoravirus inopinatum]|uniref:Uncharacterized protein n=1 Tax=Pandoravirus inopinatum TaxID=1605721 RepID=A0A0B5JAR1_9VIRU|nr:hypothetical protein TW95_gp1332 [Pandoravirus inopinatum]AJF98066.1 hypothetical protein [Pandoravirus inopinatum]
MATVCGQKGRRLIVGQVQAAERHQAADGHGVAGVEEVERTRPAARGHNTARIVGWRVDVPQSRCCRARAKVDIAQKAEYSIDDFGGHVPKAQRHLGRALHFFLVYFFALLLFLFFFLFFTKEKKDLCGGDARVLPWCTTTKRPSDEKKHALRMLDGPIQKKKNIRPRRPPCQVSHGNNSCAVFSEFALVQDQQTRPPAWRDLVPIRLIKKVASQSVTPT